MKIEVDKKPLGVVDIANSFGIIQLPLWVIIITGIIIWSLLR